MLGFKLIVICKECCPFFMTSITLLMLSKDKSYAFVTIRVSTFKSSCGVVAGFPSGYWIKFLARNIVT